MIATDPLDPFGELIAQGHVRPLGEHEGRPQQRTLQPTSLHALHEIVVRANQAGCPFTFTGGGTSLAQTPPAFTQPAQNQRVVVISLELLDRVVEYRPMDFTITVEAGMRVAQLRELLAQRGQTVTLDTPDIAQSTVGGLLASARCGPRRRALGRPRDALLGAQLVFADGTTLDTGGRSLRQARGYDFARLFVGSHGTLGAYGAVTLRTRTTPEARRCAIATLPENTRERAVASLQTLPIEPTAAVIIDGFERRLPGWEGPDGRFFLFFESGEEAINRATRELRSALGAIGISETRIFDREAEGLLDQLLDAPSPRGTRENTATIRLYGGNGDDALRIRERVHRLAVEIGVAIEMITDVQNDDVLARVRASGPRALEISAREMFIRLSAEIERAELLDAPMSFRTKFEEAQTPGSAQDARIRRLREAFDPRGLCAVDRSAIAGRT